jgi:hypothetical protein
MAQSIRLATGFTVVKLAMIGITSIVAGGAGIIVKSPVLAFHASTVNIDQCLNMRTA